MTVFKTFWKIINKYKGTIILYTVILIIFGGINMSTNDTGTTFVDSKPDILIINKDEEIGITKNLVDYLKQNSNIINVKNNEEAINDALFYRDVNYVIYIPENYRQDVLNGLNPEINIKSTGDYSASLAEMMLSRYVQIQNIYKDNINNEDELIEAINNNLSKKSSVEMTSKLDASKMTKVASYFNFASYSIMAVVIFIICLVLSSFHEKTVNKRTIISSMNYKEHNRLILFASFMYSVIVWFLYVVLGLILLGNIIFTARGLMYLLNTFVFTFCALTIALLISTIVSNKNAINGIVNVVALGSAFLCGAFVPAEWLPKAVLNIAHILPAYWYINSNDLLKTMETINFETLKPVFNNMLVILVFTILFIIMNNIISKKKQRVG
ncbi:MAG TPA: ABC transporter permease [Clostridiaceae bacterium]|nr:ABC transporter permease [Clostridiaceae bacterium]